MLTSLPAQDGEFEPLNDIDTEAVVETQAPIIESVPLHLVNQSWFIDRTGMAVVYFDSIVDEPEELPRAVKGLSFLDIEVKATPDSEQGKSIAIMRFALQETGLVTIPSIEFTAGERLYRTIPVQIMVSEAVLTEAMSLSLIPQKTRIYVGEPLRLDFSWRCDIEADRLQSLSYYPDFFNQSAVEVLIPRNTSTEALQVGLPIGGRRVIADRTISTTNDKALGTVELPLYLRWDAPGSYVIPASRLECVRLMDSKRNFGQYAAHFNNELFAAEDSRVRYERFYVESAPIEITVLPLPEAGRLPGFSGWFTPVHVDVAVTPTEVELGQVMEVELQVVSNAPHGMIELPPLNRQRSLRGRFLVDEQLGRLWRADGTTFSARVRALSTGVSAFPSLQFQVFDPETARYELLSTNPVPLVVTAGDGAGLIDISAYAGAQVNLIKQPSGIWHNLEANTMDDLMNTLVVRLADWFWLFIIIGPVAFVLLLPFVRERRRRANDAAYRERVAAYHAFRKCSNNDPEKWNAFVRFMAISFQTNQAAWTVGDSRQALQSIGASESDIEQVVAQHASRDVQDFSASHPSVPPADFSALGQRIFRLINKSALLFLMCALGFSGFSTHADASDWTEAEGLYEQAMLAPAGSDTATALFAESALKFQAVAEAGERPGIAWYNAGNAWFQTGALGRSIAAYREAQVFRPFDALIRENLSAARQLTLTNVPKSSVGLHVPTMWFKAWLVVISLIFWGVLLLWFRYRKRSLFIATCLLGLCGLAAAIFLIWQQSGAVQAGVVIADEVIARKGPGYAYVEAFDQALQDGLEFQLLESRGEWNFIEITDGRQCWIPSSQAQFIRCW